MPVQFTSYLQQHARTPALAMVVALALTASVVSPTLSAFPGANGKIAFIREPPGETTNIWTTNPDGSDEQQLTSWASSVTSLCPYNGEIGCNSPLDVTWSADGRHLAFAWIIPIGGSGAAQSLVTMDANGSNVVQVSEGPYDCSFQDVECISSHFQPSWSPDGTKLVYSREAFGEPGIFQIYVTPLGSHLSSPGAALTALPGRSEYPVWSPDGTRIAFLHSANPTGENADPYHVWIMNADGTHQTDLMLSATSADRTQIDWSPDGQRIAFTHLRAIWILQADGSASWPVTRPGVSPTTHLHPAWSPDGDRIAFACSSLSHGNYQLYEINTDGTGQRRITFNSAFDLSPDWASSSSPLPAPPTSGVPDDCEASASATTTTYTGDASGQYSDPVTLSGVLQDSSTTPFVPIAGKKIDFTLGSQATSASPTDATGTASTSLVLAQKPGLASTVETRFAGDDAYAASSDGDPFAILKEDCTLTYSGATLVPPTDQTTLAADIGEPDAYLGDRSNKTITFTATNAANQIQTFSATTDANGHASTQVPLPADVYGVTVSFAGDDYYKPCSTSADVIVTTQAATAKVTGGGWISIASGRTSFGFNAIPEAGGLWKGQIQIRANNSKSNFHGTTVLTLSSVGNAATWSGTGSWLGQANYSYSVSVVDNGSSSKKTDTIAIVIKDSRGTTVYTTGGPQVLKGGNIVVH
jgi:Tol biopolymer transport system component